MSSVFQMYDALDSAMVPPVSGRTSPSRMLHQEESNYLPLSSQEMDSHQIPSNGIPSTSVPSQGMSPTTSSSSVSPSTAMHDMDEYRHQLYASIYNPVMWYQQIRDHMHQPMVWDWTLCPPFLSSFMWSTYLQHVMPLLRDEESEQSEALDLSYSTEDNISGVENKEANNDDSTQEEMFVPPVDVSADEQTQEEKFVPSVDLSADGPTQEERMFVPRYDNADEYPREEKFVPPVDASADELTQEKMFVPRYAGEDGPTQEERMFVPRYDNAGEFTQEEKFVPQMDASADEPTQEETVALPLGASADESTREEKFVPPVVAGTACSQHAPLENRLKSKYKVGR